jgi:hypothetical protein
MFTRSHTPRKIQLETVHQKYGLHPVQDGG